MPLLVGRPLHTTGWPSVSNRLSDKLFARLGGNASAEFVGGLPLP